MDRAERIARAAKILVGAREVLASAESALADSDPERLATEARSLAETAAMLHDIAEGREYVPRGGSLGSSRSSPRGSTTRKVREALGYTYP